MDCLCMEIFIYEPVELKLQCWVSVPSPKWGVCAHVKVTYTHTHTHTHTHTLYIYIYTYRVSQEEGTKLREGVPYVKIYRYNPKHLYPKLNGYGDNGQRKVWSSGGSTQCTFSADSVPHVCPRLPCQITEIPLTLLRQYFTMADYALKDP